ncbi:hypothetical protein L596_027172 [Steinernema carpocapsae]|uniref:CUB domain-containing protein n=1 Tax=Steinernema carpocapsae TaxID=34508 RepID=A0A4U5M3N9_STECR|nr:hypothetical protein L596_027172 [Steinernema carpocapsae]
MAILCTILPSVTLRSKMRSTIFPVLLLCLVISIQHFCADASVKTNNGFGKVSNYRQTYTERRDCYVTVHLEKLGSNPVII